ncbi:hypothetical protein ACH5RR_013881 [Cinchona calisaya]|uniref:HMA domain-containing protein n=1 Tax=Cinchona calisaya TaxID=153742 RepID=A0ABD3A1A8_9GENT
MSGNEFHLVKIQTHVLKVQIHCDGCARKVKKLLKRIEGVYLVSIDTEEQKVKVSGTVDCATLIRKLTKSGKHAELWRPYHRQNQNVQGLSNWFADDKYQNSQQYLPDGVNASNIQPMFPSEFDRGIDDWSRERYLNETAGIKYLMGENNNRAITVGNNTAVAWDGDVIPDAHSLGGQLRSMGFQDHAGAFAGYGDTGYPRLQNLQASPAYYEQYYSPYMMSNNMQQYHYNLPTPMVMSKDIPDMHANYNMRMIDNHYLNQSQGVLNPMLAPVTHYSWNY